MSKEELLISLLKSEQSIAELRKSKSNSLGIEEIKKKNNMLRNNFSKEQIKEIGKKNHKKGKIDEYFSEQEKKNETKKEEQEKKTRRTREKTLHQRNKKSSRVFKKIRRRY